MMALPAPLADAARNAFPHARPPGWLNGDWFHARRVMPEPRWHPRTREAMKEQLVHIIECAHLQGLMRYEDRSAMALSIENRVPFLTRRLARFALSLPEAYLMSPHSAQKSVLRHAMRGIVPDAILDRSDRVGFAAPVVRWLTDLSPWVEQKLAAAESCPALKADGLRRQWRAVRDNGNVMAAYVLWRCLSLTTWSERMDVQWQ